MASERYAALMQKRGDRLNNSSVVIDDAALLTTLVDNVAPETDSDNLTVSEDSSVAIGVPNNDRDADGNRFCAFRDFCKVDKCTLRCRPVFISLSEHAM
jgi:hypothetical protein